jgi:hypothetical protein
MIDALLHKGHTSYREIGFRAVDQVLKRCGIAHTKFEIWFPRSRSLNASLKCPIFGHYGDRIGRKATLIATLLCMGIATFLIALVPTYESIGIWGAVILTALRMIQGIGVGGEWGGSVLLPP